MQEFKIFKLQLLDIVLNLVRDSLFCYGEMLDFKYLAVAILLSTAIYPQRLFCCELFVIGQS